MNIVLKIASNFRLPAKYLISVNNLQICGIEVFFFIIFFRCL